MWPFSRRPPNHYVRLFAYPEMTPTEILAQLPDDAARAIRCHEWAIEARENLFQGQTEVIGDMLRSKELRYRWMDARTRTAIAKHKWESSPTAISLLRLEDMYSRWAREYATFAGLKISS